jgi:hypothetical protein
VERDGHRLYSSGDGGVVQLWKTNYDGQFQCVSQIQGDLTALNGETTLRIAPWYHYSTVELEVTYNT